MPGGVGGEGPGSPVLPYPDCACWGLFRCIFLLRLGEFATLKHDPEHGVSIGLLVDEP